MIFKGEKLSKIIIELSPSAYSYCGFFPSQKSVDAALRFACSCPSKEKWFSIINNSSESGAREIILAGGEPLLNPHFQEIAKYAKLSGLKVTVKTTGAFFEGENFFSVKKFVDCVVLPFCALDEKTDLKITGIEKGFSKKLEAAKRLKKAGVFVSAEILALPENVERLDLFISLLDSLEISSWTVVFPPTGFGKPMQQKNIRLLVKKVLDYKLKGRVFKIGHGLPFCAANLVSVDEVLLDGVNLCGPFTSLTVSSSGEIRPCEGSDLIVGNVFSDKLGFVWKNQSLICKLRKTQLLPPGCKSCKALQDCRGGCRVYAKAFSGSMDSPDPRSTPGTYSF